MDLTSMSATFGPSKLREGITGFGHCLRLRKNGQLQFEMARTGLWVAIAWDFDHKEIVNYGSQGLARLANAVAFGYPPWLAARLFAAA